MKDDIALSVQNVAKQYRLGEIGTGTLSHDLNRWWYKVRGKEDPYSIVGDVNDRANVGDSDYVWALKDINFEVEKGEILGIIGKNGAGKSTLLKVLSKVTGPTTGSIKMRGRVASLLEVGTGMHPELTGRENIYLNGAILGMTKAEVKSKLDEIVDFSGCAKYIDTPVKRYSSGMMVRLGFAVAAHLEPEILIVDEVLAVGDIEFQKKAIGKMKQVSSEAGRTVLFVSHNMNSIRNLCTRGMLLENGTIKSIENVDSIISSYLSMNSEIKKDLLEISEGRNGTGEIKFANIVFKDKHGTNVDQIISGDYLEIQIDLVKLSSHSFSNFIFSILFRDSTGRDVISFVSDEMNSNFNFSGNNGKIVLKIPNIWLRGNNYYLKIRLNRDGQTNQKFVVDEIERAVELVVINGDVWNIGKSNRTGASAIFPGEIDFINK